MDEDYAFALQLSELANNENEGYHVQRNAEKPLSIVDDSWELIDPVPDIRNLFLQFNESYFDGLLACVEVKWSPKMTLCAGVCCYEGRGGLCCIKLSQPLLKLRPRKDLVNTLLHEMIHALLFVTNNNKDHDSHGAEFHKHMYRINKQTGSSITVYHSFHDEVNEYRQHWWKCDGPCAKRRPFFGIVRRAMNRAPSHNDRWWADHQKTCGGVFKKIKEPEKVQSRKSEKINSSKTTPKKALIPKSKTITDFLLKSPDKKAKPMNDKKEKPVTNTSSTIASKDKLLLGNKTDRSQMKNFQEIKTDSNNPEMFSGSSKSSSSNIHGFKMTARKNSGPVLKPFAGNGLKVGSFQNTREAFLKRIESELAIKKERKRTLETFDNEVDLFNGVKTSSEISEPVKKMKKLKGKCENTVTNKKSVRDDKYSVSVRDDKRSVSNFSSHVSSTKEPVIFVSDNTDDYIFSSVDADLLNDVKLLECPACPAKLPECKLNEHLDTCLA